MMIISPALFNAGDDDVDDYGLTYIIARGRQYTQSTGAARVASQSERNLSHY